MKTKPVLLIQHSGAFAPGFLGDCLARAGLTMVSLLVRAPGDVPTPAHVARFGGIVLGGGFGSAAGADPVQARELALVSSALEADVPVLGHGLGGRLLARAAGAGVHPTPSPETGWQALSLRPEAADSPWFGSLGGGPHHAFMHHDEACEAPPGSRVLLSSAQSPVQLFALGNALGTQFHPELTRGAFELWLADWRTRLPPPGASVQSAAEMQEQAAARIAAGRRLALALYTAWIARLPGTGNGP